MRIVLIFPASAMLLLLACSAAGGASPEKKEPATPGEVIFKSQCVMCHGRNGNLQISGAKDLTKSTLTEEEMIAIVTNGRGGMVGFGKTLSKEQVEQVVEHVRSLHVGSASENRVPPTDGQP
jgi:mono/diheme cytochrome c family protein